MEEGKEKWRDRGRKKERKRHSCTTSIGTSKQMFSPSMSQSSHSTRWSTPLPWREDSGTGKWFSCSHYTASHPVPSASYPVPSAGLGMRLFIPTLLLTSLLKKLHILRFGIDSFFIVSASKRSPWTHVHGHRLHVNHMYTYYYVLVCAGVCSTHWVNLVPSVVLRFEI